MLRDSKEKRGESVEMELPEEPPPGGSLTDLLIKGNVGQGSLGMPKVCILRESLYFYACRIFPLQVNIWITENELKRE